MARRRSPSVPPRSIGFDRPRRTTSAGFLVIVALAAAFPLTLVAIERPLVVVATLVAVSTASALVGKRR